jgi:hypothetical protein
VRWAASVWRTRRWTLPTTTTEGAGGEERAGSALHAFGADPFALSDL